MRILQACKYYYPYVGGIETVVKNMVDGLSNYDDVDIKVFATQKLGEQPAVDYIDGVEVTRVKNSAVIASMPISFQYKTGLCQHMQDADIVHFHMPFPLAEFSSLSCQYEGKIVATWHSDVVKQTKLLKIYKPFMKKFLDRTDCIIVASQNNIDSSTVLKEYEKKCAIIPFGIDVDSVKESKVQNVLKGRKDRVKILFVGRLVYYKGVDILLNAFKKVRGADLFIVGEGPLRDEMMTLSKDLGVEERAFFLGRLTEEELDSAFNECDFFVLPSVERSEAFGMVQLEAMLRSKPIINTNIGTAVSFVSIDGVTGFTVEPKDSKAMAKAMQKLIDDKELREELGRNACQRVYDQFTSQKMVNSIYELYKNLLRDK